ncbi:hypothetical protein GW915_13870 [bacterium]|nr:hypothetical protein [bacterium]
MVKLLCQLFFIGVLGVSPSLVAAEAVNSKKTPWPFDQRQILLVKEEGKGFPDELTAAQIMDVFVRRGRIRWVTQSAPKGLVLPVETPSDFAWHSTPAVRKLGLRHKTDGIMVLSQEDSRIDLKWYATLDGLPLFFETVKLPAVESDEEWKKIRKDRLTKWVDGVWDRIPGHGYVVQRDGGSLLLEGVESTEAEIGDKVDTVRIQSLERHPVLKTIVKVETTDTGYGKILSVSKDLSKAEVIYEAEIDPIEAGDRYIVADSKEAKVPDKLLNSGAKKTKESPKVKAPKGGRVSFFENKKKMVDLSAALTFSSLTHKETVSGNSYEMKSASLSPGVDLRALLYFTHAWVMGADISMAFLGFKNPPAAYGVDSISSGLSSFNIYGGYRFLLLEKLAAPADLKILAGYRSWSLSMQNTSSNIAPSAKTFSGLEIALAAGFPIYKGLAAEFRGGRTLGSSLSEKPLTSGDAPDPTFWTFGGKLTYAISKMGQFELSYMMEAAASNFDGSGQRTSAATSISVQRKVVGAGYTYAF